MDREARNRIQRATQSVRALLETEFAEQLEGLYDIGLDGTIAEIPGGHLDGSQRVLRAKLVAAIEHEKAGGITATEAVGSYLREAAFTALNRFGALKMLEARGLVQECISEGYQSSGFREFSGLAPGLLGLSDDRSYRLYIESLFDEIGREVRVLFDRRDPASLLWPRRQALHELLRILNNSELAAVWDEDETIGWTYQYFNSDEERHQMRAESSAPRNSRELAVRNQFFTPRYVVQFLTDNTLGRIWYEMRQGRTPLADLDYLVRRPQEVFLPEGQVPPTDTVPDFGELSSDELQKRATHVPFRAKKDPRDLRVLDPACGSGHFLLYAFDLMLTVYEDAWYDETSPASDATGRKLRDDYPDLDLLRVSVPGLILRHNLYGIDVDARCTQIAAMALWMRAQRAFRDLGIGRNGRPTVQKTNIVVAESMPGEPQLRQEFATSLAPDLAKLVDHVFQRMELAAETGALLRIENEIKDATRSVYPDHGQIFRMTDEERWEQAEEELLRALRDYADQATNGQAYQRRLFAEDAARGLGFVFLSRMRYDVVVMNPPFGDASVPSRRALDSILKTSGRDIGAAFVRDAAERWCPTGRIGVLLSTAPWFKPAFEQWRTDLFLGERAQLHCCAHFSGEVLDGATVNACPMVLSTRPEPVADVFRLTRASNLKDELSNRVASAKLGRSCTGWYSVVPKDSCVLPGRPFSYWMSRRLLRRIRDLPAFEGVGGTVKQGTATADEFRFSRAWWEVPSGSADWRPYVKTSPYSPFWDDITWVGKFGDSLREIAASNRARVQGLEYFGSPGVTYTSKSVLGFNPRLHPPGCGFGHTGSVAFGREVGPLALLGFLGSRPVEYLLSLFIGDLQGQAGVHPNHYEVGTIQRLPWPGLSEEQEDTLGALATQAVASLRRRDTIDEVTRSFGSPVVSRTIGLRENAELASQLERNAIHSVCISREIADRVVAEAYGFTDKDVEEMEAAFSERTPPAKGKWRAYFGETGNDIDERSYVRDVLSWAVGVAFGRWRVTASSMSNGNLDAPLEVPALSPPGSLSVGNDKAILVDDRGHRDDIISAVHEAVEGVWGERVDSVLAEASEVLGSDAGSVRRYLRHSFFGDHIRRYSKSRRKAPVYWQLATPSSSYSVWIYFHHLTRDAIYRVLNDYVTPKLQHEERKLSGVLQDIKSVRTQLQRKEVDAQEQFVEEVRSFRDEVARVAPLWNPNLHDGVIINFAPLWRLIPHDRSWQKECKNVWKKLVDGDYDWSHLAMHLWPERVIPKCAEDRSLAIAHGLEDVFWHEGLDGKWLIRDVRPSEVQALIGERMSPAVQEALKNVLEVPAPRTGRARRNATVRRPATRTENTALVLDSASDEQMSGEESVRAVDGALVEEVRKVIAANGQGAKKADVIKATGITSGQWSRVIKKLLAEGVVTQAGERRGTRYHLAGAET